MVQRVKPLIIMLVCHTEALVYTPVTDFHFPANVPGKIIQDGPMTPIWEARTGGAQASWE